ncbi:hypothetical protein ACJBU6_04009 [Exserohilum turcicum]
MRQQSRRSCPRFVSVASPVSNICPTSQVAEHAASFDGDTRSKTNTAQYLMGLGGMKSAWQRQTKDFAHTKADDYSSLVIDNRGVGDSDKPACRYSTSDMAKDVIEVIDHVGWTAKRELHIIGISMGGMIAQELAMLIPDRICTLSLVSTAAHIFRTTGFVENLWNRANLLMPKDIDQQIAAVKRNLYTQQWLDAPDSLEPVVEPFPSNGDRFGAMECRKREQPDLFPRVGFLAQAIAANWHYKSPEDLHHMAKAVGKQRIMVVHGTSDRMLTFPLGVVLWRGLEKGEGVTGKENWLGIEQEDDVWQQGEIEKRFIKGQGHVIPIEMRQEFNSWIEGLVERGIKLNEHEDLTG